MKHQARGDHAEGHSCASGSVKGRENRRFEKNAETEKMSVLTKTFEEKAVRMSLAVDAEEMESERSEAESTLFSEQEQVQNSTVEKIVTVPFPRLRPRSLTTRTKVMTSRKRVTRMRSRTS